MSSRSFSESVTERTGLPSSSAALTRLSTSIVAMPTLSPDFAILAVRSSFLSTFARSASMSSVSMISMSRIGSTLPFTCTTSPSSKQRTTCATAWQLLMWPRNWLPSPSPLLAPFTRPAMSTNSVEVGTVFLGLTSSVSFCKRLSGTSTIPTFGSIVQNG